jgi:hypothetical protein
MTRRCNIQCDGCYYYEGEKQFAKDNRDPDQWRQLILEEKERGITYVVLAGPNRRWCRNCVRSVMRRSPWAPSPPTGCENSGIRGYRIHISVWGNDETSARIRHRKGMLTQQIANYREDDRAVFVYTFTRDNIPMRGVMEMLSEAGCKATFNMFSAPVGYDGPSGTRKHPFKSSP